MNDLFEGGPIYLNSGGTGPDDYLIRRIGTRRWYRVICRWGRHFRRDIPVEEARALADADKAALGAVLHRCRRICVGDNARRYERARQAGREPATLPFAEFEARFGETKGGAR